MTPYSLVLTQRKQYCTISFGDADVAETVDRLVWTIDSVELDGRVKTKIFKACRENFLGGTAGVAQGAMYAAPIEDVAHQVKSVLGEDVRSRRVRVGAEAEVERAKVWAADEAGRREGSADLWFGAGQGIGTLLKVAIWSIWTALRLAGWLLLVPFVLSAFRHRGGRH